MIWFVPVRLDLGRWRNVRVEAEGEWAAQSVASERVRAEPITKKRPYALLVEIDHARPA